MTSQSQANVALSVTKRAKPISLPLSSRATAHIELAHARATTSRPDIDIAENNVRVAELEVSKQRGYWLPTFTFDGGSPFMICRHSGAVGSTTWSSLFLSL